GSMKQLASEVGITVFGATDIEHADHIGMRQASRSLSFTLKARQLLRVTRVFRMQHLESVLLRRDACMARSVDSPYTAFAETLLGLEPLRFDRCHSDNDQ